MRHRIAIEFDAPVSEAIDALDIIQRETALWSRYVDSINSLTVSMTPPLPPPKGE